MQKTSLRRQFLTRQITEFIRNLTVKEGKMTSSAKRMIVCKSVYEMYYSFEEPVSRLAGHRILALNRGEKEKDSERED